VVLESDGRQMLIYKHAMSTITPQRPVNTSPQEQRAE
jgi:host factor-I protein